MALIYPHPVQDPDGTWRWRQLWLPTDVITVWIDPRFAGVKDAHGQPAIHSIRNAFAFVGRVANLGFWTVDTTSQAWFRIWYGTATEVCNYSRGYGNAKQWYGTDTLCSSYMAIHSGKRDIVIGTQLKLAMGSAPCAPVHMIHFVQNAIQQCLLGLPYNDPSAPIHAARNANFSGPISFPVDNPSLKMFGLAGFDIPEINRWQAFVRSRHPRANPHPWIHTTRVLEPIR